MPTYILSLQQDVIYKISLCTEPISWYPLVSIVYCFVSTRIMLLMVYYIIFFSFGVFTLY